MGDQVRKHLEDARLEVHGLAMATELVGLGRELELAEAESHGGLDVNAGSADTLGV